MKEQATTVERGSRLIEIHNDLKTALRAIQDSPTGKPGGLYFDYIVNRPDDCHTLGAYDSDE